MAFAERILPHYTYDDYVHWEGKWELIEGFAIAGNPLPSPKHQWVNANLVSEFRQALKSANCRHCKVYMPLDYKIAEDTILQPDMMIVCSDITKKYLDKAPVLVVEILSPSTMLRDRHTKYNIYERQGVKYYLLVNIDSEKIEIFENNGDSFQNISFEPDQPFSFKLEEGCAIDLTVSEVWK